MFHFPAFPPHTLCIQVWVTGHDSCRVSPFGNPRITARLAAPRGLSQPPTSFIGSWCQGIHRAPLITWPQRCSRPLCSSQGTGGPDRLQPSRTALAPKCEGRRSTGERAERAPLPQDPTACLRPRHLPSIRSHLRRGCTRRGSRCHGRTGQRSTHEHQAGMHIRHWLWTTPKDRQVLLRKEVIQPHLPVRLPCYDFVPIAGPTFDHSPPTSGLGHGLRVLPTFVT
jgi:hypothetical protein